MPFVEEVKAYVSLEKRTIWVFIREVSTPNGLTPPIHIMAEYYVKDGVMLWRSMASNIECTQFSGFTRPVDVDQTTKCLEQQVKQLVRQVTIETTNDPARQGLFKDKKNIESFILDRLNELSGQFGVAFSLLDMEVYLHDA